MWKNVILLELNYFSCPELCEFFSIPALILRAVILKWAVTIPCCQQALVVDQRSYALATQRAPVGGNKIWTQIQTQLVALLQKGRGQAYSGTRIRIVMRRWSKSVTGAGRICERMRSAVIRHTCPLSTLHTLFTLFTLKMSTSYISTLFVIRSEYVLIVHYTHFWITLYIKETVCMSILHFTHSFIAHCVIVDINHSIALLRWRKNHWDIPLFDYMYVQCTHCTV